MTRKEIIILAGAIGICLGLGLYTFEYAEGLSYFSKDPKACVNCHIMQPQYDSWQKSGHHTAATCIECHLPHDFIPKYLAKADNGYRHYKGFTFQNFHEPIMMTEHNKKILQANCIRCHGALVHDIAVVNNPIFKNLDCIHCHNDVGHGDRAGMGKFENISSGENQ